MKKFLSKFNIYHIEILFLLIVGLIPLLWYKSGYIGLGHDMGFPLAPVDHFLDRLYTWTDRLGPFGSNSMQVLPGVFIHGFEALLSSFGFSLLAVQKITYIFWFVLPGITMYTLLHYLHPKKEDYLIRIPGSLFYMMNHYLLQAWTIAERTKFSIVAALPIVVLLIIRVLHKKESPVKNSILFALTLFFLNGGEGIPLLIVLFIVVITTVITFFFLSRESFWPKTKRLLVFSFLAALFWILLSGYWLYPYFKSYSQAFGQRSDVAGGAAGAISWSQGISANASWINLFRLRGIPDWYASSDHPYANEFFKNPLLLFLNVFFPALALIGLLNLDKTRIYFLSLLFIGIPLSAGSHSPLGIFYDYLLVNLPGFIMFRSGFFKFGMIIWFAYAYLIAVGVKDLIVRSKRIPLVWLGAFIILLFIYNYPFFTGTFFDYSKGKSTMVKVPDYIFEAKKELGSNKFSTRTLYLPNADIRTEYIEYDWGYFSLSELTDIMGRKSSIRNGALARPDEKDLMVGILSEYIKFGKSNLVKFIGVDRAVVQNDFISPDYEGNPLSGAKESFSKSNDFIFKKNIGRWDFYNYNKDILPQIYSPSAITFISSDQKSLDIVANMPGALDSNAFLWSESPEDSNKEEIFDKLIIQARCADCPPVDSYQIYFSTSKVLIPGTPFYQLGKFVTSMRKHFAGNPNVRLEINLSASTTLISDLGLLQAKRDEKGIKIATRDLIQNLEEIKNNLEDISDLQIKKEVLKKVRFFLSFFVSYETQWATAAQPGPIKLDLESLETELRKSVAEIEGGIGHSKIEEDAKLYKYSLDISQTGDYDLYLYNPSSLSDGITLNVNNRIFRARKLSSNWYKITKVPLESTSTLIEITKIQASEVRPIIFVEIDTNVPDFDSPNIEFVALNQTKYLVRTKGSEHFLLGFNSRFDQNWSLREIKQEVGSYFKGDTRSFQNGKVVEYERQDAHVITDIIFPSDGKKLYPTLKLNGISSGWILNPQNLNQTAEHVYLLEYNNQNDFYKVLAVSLVTLIFILSLYFLKFGKIGERISNV